ncbi:hypothetical protein B566_EDAN014871 [Ephemera danica]|nr:hypothetical protein B566_EDAN014871 [Ephemera danica]
MRASLQRIHDGHITSPQALYDFLRQHMLKIKFDFVSIAEFKDEELILNKRYKNAKNIRGTQNIHCIVPVRKDKTNDHSTMDKDYCDMMLNQYAQAAEKAIQSDEDLL